jgi:hypothetical protein
MNKALKTLLVALAVLALSALGAVAAFAGAPTFTKVSATITSGTGGGTTTAIATTSAADASLAASTTTDVLLVSFTENRLGNTDTFIDYTVEANAFATYVCINGGSKNPKASNKATVGGPVTVPGTFSSDANGNVKGSIEVEPPGPGAFTCPTGQRLVLVRISFTDIQLTDITNQILAEIIPGPVFKDYPIL